VTFFALRKCPANFVRLFWEHRISPDGIAQNHAVVGPESDRRFTSEFAFSKDRITGARDWRREVSRKKLRRFLCREEKVSWFAVRGSDIKWGIP
jgi:hypothetical protein